MVGKENYPICKKCKQPVMEFWRSRNVSEKKSFSVKCHDKLGMFLTDIPAANNRPETIKEIIEQIGTLGKAFDKKNLKFLEIKNG